MNRQVGRWFCSEGELGLIPKAEKPVSMGGAHGDFTLTVDGPIGHAEVPISLPPYLHL